MATEGRFDVVIHECRLSRNYDAIKPKQDVYIELARVYPNGKENRLARTETCKGGNLNPKWGEEFVVNQAGGRAFGLRVFIAHSWRPHRLCGEAELPFDELLWSLAQGSKVAREVQLLKKGAPTGSIRLTIGKGAAGQAKLVSPTAGSPKVSDAGRLKKPICRHVAERANEDIRFLAKCAAGAPQKHGDPAAGSIITLTDGPVAKVAPTSLSALPPDAFAAEIRKMLNRPEELEERVRMRFRQMASPAGADGRLAMTPEDCPFWRALLAERLGVPAEVFGEIHQMFWRFEVSGHSRLYEAEATRMIMCCLRQYRDSVEGPQAGAQQLGQTNKTHQLADTHEVVRELGRGGQGIALLAKDKATKREVVVKMYSKTNQKGAAEDISQEFELLMTLKHPRIARVFDIFQDLDNVYIVQEPYFGGDLTTAVQNAYNANVKVDELWVCEVMRQVLTGVEFLHNNCVIHSDLKEPNVMVASHKDWRHPQVIVIDFGLANKFSSKSGVAGTPGYMPPEVWDYGLWTPRGDIFSIGVMMFTIRTGAGPFNPDGRKTLGEIKEATRENEVRMDRGSPQLQKLVHSMLHKQFLQRAIISQVMKDPWFEMFDKGQDLGTALDVQALEKLANQRQRTDLFRALVADVASKQNLAQLKDLNQTFMSLDVNNDGKISAAELRRGLRGVWKDADTERLVAVLGIDDGGEVSYDEFIGELCAARVPEENALLRRLFAEADVHRRGFLGVQELADLASRPSIVQHFGSEEAALARMKSMDASGTGRVTFDDFRRAMQGGSQAGRVDRAGYRNGQAVQYWSTTHLAWIDCVVTNVDAGQGAVEVTCKPGQWLTGERLRVHLRAVGGKEPPGYRVGQSVEMYSASYSTWIPCTVARADAQSGAIQVSQKPDYWFMGEELATRLRPAGSGAPDARPAGGPAAPDFRLIGARGGA